VADGRIPLFSVVVPTRNRADTLRRTLAGIALQTFDDFEVIVIDDGSSATTRTQYPELLAAFDRRFRIVCRSPDDAPGRGPAAARNDALTLARGEFVAFCDDDDFWCQADHLEVAARALATVPDADIYYANQAAYRGAALLDADRWPQLRAVLPRAPRVGAAEVYRLSRGDLLRQGGTAHLNISIVRRRLIEDIGGFWDHLRYEEDLDFYLRTMDRARAILYRPVIAARHFAPDQQLKENASTQFEATEKWLARCLVCEHVRVNVRSAQALALARSIQGYALRHLTAELSRKRQYPAALTAGAQAFAVMPGCRWLGFLAYLWVRGALARWRILS
jgi:glycosyltransferase involved in cell wall biosynthesis